MGNALSVSVRLKEGKINTKVTQAGLAGPARIIETRIAAHRHKRCFLHFPKKDSAPGRPFSYLTVSRSEMDDGGTELTYPVLRYPTFSAPPLSPEVASCDKMHEDAMSDEESFPPSYSQSLPSIFVNVAWEDSSKKPFGFLTLPSLHVPLAEVREALYDQIDHKDITRQSTSSEDDIEKKRRIHLRFIREGVTVSPQQENTVVLDDILHRPTTTKTKSKSSTTATPSPILILRRLAPKPAKSKSEKSRGGWCCGCKCYHALLLLALVFSFSLLAASSRPSISESYSYVVSTQAGSSSLTESSAVDAPLPTPAGGGSSSSSSEDDSNTPPWMHPVFKLMHFILKTLIVLITEYYQLMIYMFSGNNPLYQVE